MSAGGSHTSQLHLQYWTVEESDGVNIDQTCFSPSSSVSVVQPSRKQHAPIVDEQTAQNQPPQPEQDKPTETQNQYSRTEELLLENLLATKNLTKAVGNMRKDLHRHIDRALARVNKEQRQAIDQHILDAIYL
ncbi:uncharacterized protein LOC128663527 isoform X2 [Bombina bombina]|uniref:uncharacterized protein LOC128663527 isoform X2 n=1 Tax=Bombina bombina TaxID=8345 RepID=UPI00235A6645|nr:uncharacterized protein LOC128663527 isoform X2 [Bombina bombina]